MKRFSEQFKKKSDSIRLRASERSDLRDRLESYMEYHPLPAELKIPVKAPARKRVEGLVSEPFKTIAINMTYIRGFAGVFAIFMVVGVPIIAEKAVPGDMLYAVKTNITEEVRASLTLSPYAKVEWETKRLERRVSEARLLASEGKLTAETEAVVAQAVQEHTDAVTQEIAAIREDNEDEAAMAEIAFASALSVQSEVLEGHVENEGEPVEGEEEGHSIAALADVVSDASDEADVAQADAAPSYEALLGSVEAETTRAYELFESVQKRAGEEEILDIERRLADVERKLVEAITLHNGDTLVEEVAEVQEVTEPEEVLAEEVVEEAVDESVESEEDVVEAVPSDEPEEVVLETTEEEAVEEVTATQEERDAQAVELLRLALTDVQKLIIFMTDIDVRENVTIQELVPVTFTDEERTEKILTKLDEALLIQSDIERRIISGESSEKVGLGIELLDGQLESVATMLEEGNLSGSEKTVAEALAIAQDIQKLVSDAPVMELEVEKIDEVDEEEETKEEGSVEEGIAIEPQVEEVEVVE